MSIYLVSMRTALLTYEGQKGLYQSKYVDVKRNCICKAKLTLLGKNGAYTENAANTTKKTRNIVAKMIILRMVQGECTAEFVVFAVFALVSCMTLSTAPSIFNFS